MAGLRAKRIALDLGANSVKACELVQTPSGLQLTKFAHVSLGIDPSMPPEEKETLKQEGIRRALKAGNFKHKRVILAVPGQSVFVRNRLLPPVQESRLAQIVQYEIQQQIPFPLDQIALDYQVIKRTETKEYDVMMSAIKVDTVDTFAGVILDSKLKIDAVDVSPVATYNWLLQNKELSKEAGETSACIDIGASTTDIFIERDGEFRFTRSLTIAGNHITEAIKDALGVPYQEAERLKTTVGRVPLDSEGPPDASTQEGKVGAVIGEVLGRLSHEINRSFGFFRTQSGGSPVAKVVLCGGSAVLRNMQQFMAERLEVPVTLANPFANLAIAPSAATAQSVPHLLPTCLGLALRNVTTCPLEINLIPPRVAKAEKRREQAVYWALSFFTLVLIGMAVVPIRAAQHKNLQQVKDILATYIKTYQDKELTREQVMKDLENYRLKYKILNEMAGPEGRSTWLPPLTKVCKEVPKGVTIAEIATIEFSDQLASGAAPSGGFGRGAFGASRLGGAGAPALPVGGASGALGGGGVSFFGGRDRDSDSSRPGLGGRSGFMSGTVTIPKSNGLRVVGYAESLRQIEEFQQALQKVFRKVVWYPTAVTSVDRYSLQGRGTTGMYAGGSRMSQEEEERGRGGAFRGLFGGGRYTGPTAQQYTYQNPELAEQNQIFQFTIDIGL
jgi:type IV pilus assembly protein PilM